MNAHLPEKVFGWMPRQVTCRWPKMKECFSPINARMKNRFILKLGRLAAVQVGRERGAFRKGEWEGHLPPGGRLPRPASRDEGFDDGHRASLAERRHAANRHESGGKVGRSGCCRGGRCEIATLGHVG